MPRGKMSAEGRAKIAAAARKRWARVRAMKKSGDMAGAARLTGRRKSVAATGGKAPMSGLAMPKRRGRPPKSAASTGHNPYLNMTINDLVSAKRQIDEAWSALMQMVR